MLAERFVTPRAAAEGDESLASFVTRRFGREVFERLAEPIVANLYTADADRLSLGTTMPRFLEMERRYGSVSRALSQAGRQNRPISHGKHAVAYANAVYLRGGLGRIVEEIGRRLPESCVCTATAERIERVSGSGMWKVGVQGLPAIEAEAVVLACPAYVSASLLAGVDTAARDALRQLRYASCATVNLVYREFDLRLPERSFGFFVPRTERCELLACSFVSRKFEGRVPRGQALLRVFLGGARHPDVADLDEEELGRRAHQELARLLPVRAEPLLRHVHRLSRAMPQYEVGYPEQIGQVERRLQALPGLFLAGTAVGAFGLPDCIESGERAASLAFEFLARRPAARPLAFP
jgi:oxygen-dependent protoporphyrinogen oxidase